MRIRARTYNLQSYLKDDIPARFFIKKTTLAAVVNI